MRRNSTPIVMATRMIPRLRPPFALRRRSLGRVGHVSDADLASVKAAGYSEAEIIEIVLLVALNTLTNYVNNVAQTDIDFPEVKPFK
jgi:hypothetical protein